MKADLSATQTVAQDALQQSDELKSKVLELQLKAPSNLTKTHTTTDIAVCNVVHTNT